MFIEFYIEPPVEEEQHILEFRKKDDDLVKVVLRIDIISGVQQIYAEDNKCLLTIDCGDAYIVPMPYESCVSIIQEAFDRVNNENEPFIIRIKKDKKEFRSSLN